MTKVKRVFSNKYYLLIKNRVLWIIKTKKKIIYNNKMIKLNKILNLKIKKIKV